MRPLKFPILFFIFSLFIFVAFSIQSASAYVGYGNIRYFSNSTAVVGASIQLQCADCDTSAFTLSNLYGAYSCTLGTSCHNGHLMTIWAHKTVGTTHYRGAKQYTASGGSDRVNVYIKAQVYPNYSDLTIGMDPIQFVNPGEVMPAYGSVYISPDQPPIEANEIYVEFAFDASLLQCTDLIVLPPFDDWYYIDIDNNSGLISILADAAGFVPIGDSENPTILFQSEWLANIYKTPMVETYVVPQNSSINTTSGLGDLIEVWSQCLIGMTPEVRVTITPTEFPVMVPAGGYFTYQGNLWNTTDVVQVVDVWTMVDVPDNGLFGPLFRVNNVHIQPNDFLSAYDVVQDIPEYAPMGNYDYIAYCGDYPDGIVDEFSFPFSVVADSKRVRNNGSWAVTEWSFAPKGSDIASTPQNVSLSLNNYPNPFNAYTDITFQIPSAGEIDLSVFDISGRRVATLSRGYFGAGYHTMVFDGSDLPSGVYFCKLTCDGYTKTSRMTLLK